MRVTLLTIWRLIKNFTAQIWKPFTVGPLTDHQSGSQASTTQLSALKKGKARLQLFCLNSQWPIFFSYKKDLLAELHHSTGHNYAELTKLITTTDLSALP